MLKLRKLSRLIRVLLKHLPTLLIQFLVKGSMITMKHIHISLILPNQTLLENILNSLKRQNVQSTYLLLQALTVSRTRTGMLLQKKLKKQKLMRWS